MIGLSIERPILDHHPKAHIHEIWQISPWNLVDFTMKSSRFHHEIWWISPWNLVDFTMKSSRFHHEIQQISWNPWNPVDFTMKSGGFHENPADFRWNQMFQKSDADVSAKNSSDWSFKSQKTSTWSSHKSSHSMKSGGFHTDFIKSGRFHTDFMKSSGFSEIQQISYRFHMDFMKSGRFHTDFTLKSGGFHHEIWQISWNPWNPADFKWNPVDFTQISPVKSTQNYKSKWFSKNSSVWWMQGGGFHPRNLVDFTLKSGGFQPWNLVDFTQIWPVKSTQNYKSKCFSKTLQFDECRVGAMTKYFMKSTRFHPEIWWISPVKSSRVHRNFIYEIHPKL